MIVKSTGCGLWVFISSLWCQCLQNLAENGERSVLTLGSVCLPCCVWGIQREADNQKEKPLYGQVYLFKPKVQPPLENISSPCNPPNFRDIAWHSIILLIPITSMTNQMWQLSCFRKKNALKNLLKRILYKLNIITISIHASRLTSHYKCNKMVHLLKTSWHNGTTTVNLVVVGSIPILTTSLRRKLSIRLYIFDCMFVTSKLFIGWTNFDDSVPF